MFSYYVFAVGMPVSRHPPHRPGRAVFPLRGFLGCTRFRDDHMMTPYNCFAIPRGEVCLFCVRFVRLVHRYFSSNSATDATLNTGDWLGLSRQGLSPCKMHQAFLGARTMRMSSAGIMLIERSDPMAPTRFCSILWLDRSFIKCQAISSFA
jgi:hypothetical protein